MAGRFCRNSKQLCERSSTALWRIDERRAGQSGATRRWKARKAMKLGSLYGSKGLSAEDLEGKSVIVTITKAELVSFDDGAKKVRLSFGGAPHDKELVVNKTNYLSLVEITGSDDSDAWIGHALALFPTKVAYQGKQVPAIRIRSIAEEQQLRDLAKIREKTFAPKPAPRREANMEPLTADLADRTDSGSDDFDL
jgi:hypothetical protein